MKKITESELKDRVNLLKEYLASLDERVTPDGKGGYTGRLVPQPGDSDYVPPTAAPATAPATAQSSPSFVHKNDMTPADRADFEAKQKATNAQTAADAAATAAATGKLNPDAKCTMCGKAYKDHFNFEPAGDPTGKVTSNRFRHPASPTDDFFPGLHEAPPTASATSRGYVPEPAAAGGPPYPEPKDGIRPRGSKWNPQTGQWDYTPLVPTPAPATTPTAVATPVPDPAPAVVTQLPPIAPAVAADSSAKVSSPAAVPVDPRDGPTGQALARMGISKQNRLDQAFVNRILGPGYTAGSAASNLALLKTKPATPTPPSGDSFVVPKKELGNFTNVPYPPTPRPMDVKPLPGRMPAKESVTYADDQTLARIVSLSRR